MKAIHRHLLGPELQFNKVYLLLNRPVCRVKRSAIKSSHVDSRIIGENHSTPVVLSQMVMPFGPSKALFLAVHKDKIGLHLLLAFEPVHLSMDCIL